MAEFIHSEEQYVSKGEQLIFENKGGCSFSVATGIIFRESGLYQVTIDGNRTIVTKVSEKKGKWISVPSNDLWKCANCGQVIFTMSEKDRKEFHRFCSRCGAENGGAE